jgi:hypothetical protein
MFAFAAASMGEGCCSEREHCRANQDPSHHSIAFHFRFLSERLTGAAFFVCPHGTTIAVPEEGRMKS